MRNRFLALAVVAFGLCSASTALAAPPPPDGTYGGTPCLLTDIGPPSAISCLGWFHGNLNNSSPLDKGITATDLNLLLGTSYTAATFPVLEDLTGLSGSTVDFATPLYGLTVVAFHVGAATGAAGDIGYQATAFYKFDAGNILGGLDTFSFNRPGLSNARLFSTESGVPEPATWALMIGGFGLAGATLRRRRTAVAA